MEDQKSPKDNDVERCPWGRKLCIKKTEHNTKICPYAPCDLNANRWGTHERIKDHFLWHEDWKSAYYYIQDLLSLIPFSCPVEEMDEIRERRHKGEEIELTDYPMGCKVFVISNRLKSLKRHLVKHQYKYAELDDDDIGNNVKETYRKKRAKFIEYIDSFMDTIKHLGSAYFHNLRAKLNQAQLAKIMLLFTKESKEKHIMNPEIFGANIEDTVRTLIKSALEEIQPEKDNKIRPKQEQIEEYKKVGKENEKRIKEKYGENLEKITKKTLEEIT
ncbi:MAG: hypothetical protein ACOC4M_04545 [Promethearchaeia archaeon]